MKAKHVSEIQKERALETREKINNWFHSNPFLTADYCSKELGISIATVSRHVQFLKSEARSNRNSKEI